METDCPCGSEAPYGACCGPLHRGDAEAPTAVQLMRSRYSAFAVGDPSYLLRSWHPATRPESADLDSTLQWRRLRILGLTGGAEDDDVGTVEFVAHYWDSAERAYGRHHENSRFVRQGGRWLYVEPVD